jgi:DNA-binding response OmpR family regulator
MDTKRILLIDDERAIQEIVQICLSTLGGWQVLTASTVPEGLRIAQQQQPDLILLDLFLPNMNGMSFLKTRLTCSLIQSIPVIILSAGLCTFHPKYFAAFDIASTIHKPFEVDTLVDCVARVLNQPTSNSNKLPIQPSKF